MDYFDKLQEIISKFDAADISVNTHKAVKIDIREYVEFRKDQLSAVTFEGDDVFEKIIENNSIVEIMLMEKDVIKKYGIHYDMKALIDEMYNIVKDKPCLNTNS